jgi:pimeloyl-ACP methyl ester carboxylesterase
MPRRSQFVAVLAAVPIVVAGCASGEPEAVAPSPPPRASATAGAEATSAAPSGDAATEGPSPSPTAVPDLSRFYDQKIDWHSCGNAECGTLVVPLDYRDPEGPTIKLGITRVKARGDSIGSLFVDPGGPGGSAVNYAQAADGIVGAKVRDHYDVVGVDPRGVGKSTPVECLTDKQKDEFAAIDGTPDDAAEEAQAVETSAILGKGCAAGSPKVFGHVGTTDAARDLDVARAAVGDPLLQYLGKSYGTMLGATYAELFPDKVGRMVLDGVLPVGLDMEQITKGQADSFEWMVHDFARYCLKSSDCPLHGSEDDAVAQLQQWLKSLDSAPLKGADRPLTEPWATYALVSNLYFPGYDYPRLKSALKAAMDGQDPKPLFGILDDRISRGTGGHYLDNSSDAFYAVTCLDRPFNGTVDDVKRIAQEWQSTAPTFGESLAWGMLPCADWPASTEPITKATAPGSNPILVVSTRHDPATPYQWGVQVADELENATLVTYEGKGHTAYGEGSACVDNAVNAYLLKGTVPEKDLVCS